MLSVVANPRKRGRDVAGGGAAATGGGVGGTSSAAVAGSPPINWFSLQPQPPAPTLINLSQLHNHQAAGVSTGLRLAFGDQQQHHHHHQQQQQQQGLLLPSSFLSSSLLSDDHLTAQIKQQRDEIDQFLQAQGDQLRRTLAERRERHYRALLGAAEESATRRLREKEVEVEKAARRNAELEERVAQLRVEAQLWQSKARAQEVTAATLQAQLQQAMMCGGGGGVAQDKNTNSREECGGGGGEAEDAESAHVDPERVVVSGSCGGSAAGPMCRGCRTRAATVVLLPCRHLSLCTGCNAAVDACPRCATRRTTSVEVFLS